MIHRMQLNPLPFNALKNGYRTIDLRLNDEKSQNLHVGDTIIFYSADAPSEVVSRIIKALHYFNDFTELFAALPLLQIGYTPFTIQDVDPHCVEEVYPIEDQEAYGVVGIELETEPFQKYLVGQSGVMAECSGYATALEEIRTGMRMTDWIWYIFPVLTGVAEEDSVTEFYALSSMEEARAYYQHPVLGSRLVEITNALLELPDTNLVVIMGLADALKVNACMTLFAYAVPEETAFRAVLKKYCMNTEDEKTVMLLKERGEIF